MLQPSAATFPRLPAGRAWLAVLPAGLTALGFGWLLPAYPWQALALLILVPLALWAPVASLTMILFVTVLVPFDVQNRLAVAGGVDVPGVLAVDLLLLLSLLRVAVLVVSRRVEPPGPVLLAAAMGVMLAAALAVGVFGGANVSEAGTEARRAVLGVGAFILAWPLLDDAPARRRLYRGLIALGLVLGIWGVAQWALGVEYTAQGDVGVRPGIDQKASVGTGQLQGGLYAFGVAVILSVAALLWGKDRSAGPRALIATVLGLNLVCVLLTHERTFWAATAIGCIVVAVKSGRRSWWPALRWAAIAATALLLAVATVAPAELRTATERLASVVSYLKEDSFLYRVVEGQAAIDAIAARPLTGSGFGAALTFGKENRFRTQTVSFVHNGYLWLAWKIGIPLALLIVLAIAGVALRRAPPTGDPASGALRIGSQAALIALLAINVTFPAFNTLGITAAMGTLVAACLWPQAPRRRRNST